MINEECNEKKYWEATLLSKEKSITMHKEDYFLLYTDHQTYHRGQIVTLLKYLSKEGVNTDFFSYIMIANQ